MKKVIGFDVLIVYNEKLAASASGSSVNTTTPFRSGSRNESYNVVYGYFLEVCARNHLRAAFSTSADITGAGSCRSYWSCAGKRWLKHNHSCYSELIFDKFSPTDRGIKLRRELLFSSQNIKPFNDANLFNLFFDKQRTYERLSEYSIPTVSLQTNTLRSIENACRTLAGLLNSHHAAKDFSSDLIMKDRFGSGGRRVYRFKSGRPKKMLAITRRHNKVSFVVQPFAKFNRGFGYRDLPACTDIRFVYLNGEIVQSYIREATRGDFRCNEHRGGALTYVSLDEIPQKLVERSMAIANILDKRTSLFTLDFIVSNNGNFFLLEGNTGPGLDWNVSLKRNEIEAKKLIRLVVRELGVRARSQKVTSVDRFTF